MTTPPPPPSLLIANSSGTVTGTHVAAAARLAPLRALASSARKHWVWTAFGGSLVVFIGYLALPATNPLAIAIGTAGATATVFILTELWGKLSDLFSAARSYFVSTSVAVFADGSRPGWAAPGTSDPNIRDIVINYNLDPSAYKK